MLSRPKGAPRDYQQQRAKNIEPRDSSTGHLDIPRDKLVADWGIVSDTVFFCAKYQNDIRHDLRLNQDNGTELMNRRLETHI